jgi:hypothetical protein
MKTELNPSLQHLRYGLVSEDGIIQADMIEKNKYSDTNMKNIDNTNKSNSKKSTLDKAQEARNRRKAKKLRKEGKPINPDELNEYSNQRKKELEAYRAKMRASKSKTQKEKDDAIDILKDIQVDKYLKNGEPKSEFKKMNDRDRKAFLKRVESKKNEMQRQKEID